MGITAHEMGPFVFFACCVGGRKSKELEPTSRISAGLKRREAVGRYSLVTLLQGCFLLPFLGSFVCLSSLNELVPGGGSAVEEDHFSYSCSIYSS